MNTKRFAVIVAGGKGVRMGNDTPKQFLLIAGKPILMHTIAVFAACKPQIDVVVVLPERQVETWNQKCEEYHFELEHKVVFGGSTRTESVKNGLDAIEGNGLVAIHDGVRPLVTPALINTSYEVAKKKGSAIVSVPLKDSIRKIAADGSSTAKNRSHYHLVQTPQTFQLPLIKKAYEKALQNKIATFTDDASVFEAAGHSVSLVSGNYQNIKITTPDDLLFANAFLH